MSGIGIAPQSSSQRSRRPLLSSCALAAALVAVGHSPVMAQSYNGTVLGTPSGVSVNNSLPGQTTINIDTSNAIINWQPTDTAAGSTPINFQDAGTTATFFGPASGYTVLNRILPGGAATGRPVQLNGTTNSNVSSVRGGAIWFYSPDGLIIGSQASINVGSLLLTTRNITDSEFLTSNGVYNFGSADNSRAAITIQSGAMIDAQHDPQLGISSYVAMVAPRIKQGGNVRVDGSAAYVAAEQATITINNGLFGIEVQSGSAVNAGTSGDDVTLEHTGSTGGPSSSGFSDPQSIYMVAIPKNVAVTMLVGGNVGYDATSAGIQNGNVVLSAGFGINDFDSGTNAPAPGVGANATITGGTFSSNTSIIARTAATVQGNLSVDGSLQVTGGRNASLNAGAGETITISQSLGIQALNTDDAGNYVAGTAAIDLGTNARLEVLGQTNVQADALGDGDARGGVASVTAGSGANFLTSGLAIRADARSYSGNAQGGIASLSLTGATLNTGYVTVSAEGDGANALVAANGVGGTASITANNSTLSVTDGIFVQAGGFGGAGFDGNPVSVGGTGTGGNASFAVNGATSSITTQGPISIAAQGRGVSSSDEGNSGSALVAGGGLGGVASYTQSAGAVTAGRLEVDASGAGGDGRSSFTLGIKGSDGGTGAGGTATANFTGGTLTANEVRVSAYGEGGWGGDGFEFGYGGGTGTGPDGGNAGTAIGGTASFTVGSQLVASSVTVEAYAAAGFVGSSDSGNQGMAADAFGGGANGAGGATLAFIDSGAASLDDVSVSASAYADSSASGGGNANGGKASIIKSGTGNVSFGESTVDVSAQAGNATANGASAGNALAGSASLLVTGGTLNIDNMAFQLDALAGSNLLGNGGNATGADVTLRVNGAALDMGSALIVNADANGGGGLTGGFGQGGRIDMLVGSGATFTSGDTSVLLSATGSGGTTPRSAANETGGAGIGGNVTLTVTGANLNILGDLGLDASGQGGSSAGMGGASTGGDVALTINGAGALDVAGALSMNAGANNSQSGSNGSGITGGTANGGSIALALADNARLSTGSLDASTNAFGGDGAYSGAGGAAAGGTISLEIAAGSAGSILDIGSGLNLNAGARGGAVQFASFSGTGSGGRGATGTGGDITVRTINGTINVGDVVNVNASGSGGRTSDFNGGVTGNAGSGVGGNILFDTGLASWTMTDLAINASGNGAFAAEVGYGNGGDGGTGTGGTAQLIVGTGSLTATSLFVDASGYGGAGGDGSTDLLLGDIAGGAGGAATGGLASIAVNGGSLTSGSLLAYADAYAGRGGNSFGNAGAGAGGNALAGGYGTTSGGAGIAVTAGGELNGSDISVSARGYGGAGGFVGGSQPNGPNVSNGGNASGGRANISITDSAITATTARIDTTAYGGSPAASSFGGTSANAGSAIGGTAELILGSANTTLDALTITAYASGGGNSFSQTGNAQGGTARISTSGGALGVAQSLNLTAGAISQGGSGLAPTVQGGTASFEASNGTTINLGAGTLTVNAAATITQGAVDSGFTLFALTPLPAGPGTVIGGTATLTLDGVSLNLAGDLQLDASAGGSIPSISAQGGTATLVVANGGALGVAGDISLNANGIATDGDTGGIGQGGTVTLRADGGSINAAQIVLDANGTGGASFSGTGGAAAGGDIHVDIVQAGSIATDDLTATANGIGGSNSGSAAGNGGNATGGNIRFTGNGVVTLANSLNLVAFGQGGFSSGGSPGAGSGGDVMFDGGSINAGGTATVLAGGNINMLAGSVVQSNTAISFNAGNDILVAGALSLLNSASDAPVQLTAGNNIRVDTATGSILLGDQAGVLGGRLTMTGSTIFVGTQQAWTDISALTNVDAIDRRLGANDGIVNAQGALRANGMEFRVQNGLYIQNSGTNLRPSAQRAGFTVGGGGVTIFNFNSTGSSIPIVINGRQALSDGTFATGKDLIPLLTIFSSGSSNGGSGSPNPDVTVAFDPRSTVNGCLITGDTCRTDTPPSIGLPQQDVIAAISGDDEDFDGETGLVQSLNTPVIRFAELTGLSTEPVIDQPVTGAGNEGFWLDAGTPDTGDVGDQVTSTRRDEDDQSNQGDDKVDQQVTGTRNDNLDEPVTGTRNENLDQPTGPEQQ